MVSLLKQVRPNQDINQVEAYIKSVKSSLQQNSTDLQCLAVLNFHIYKCIKLEKRQLNSNKIKKKDLK